MKPIVIVSVLSLAWTGCAVDPESAEDDDNAVAAPAVVDPASLKIVDAEAVRQALAPRRPAKPAANGLPMSSYTVTAAQDGQTYTGTIVGKKPSRGRPTTVPTVLVPVILTIVQGGQTYVFDPTSPDPGCLGPRTALELMQASPVFSDAPFTINGQDVGTTQYTDAIMRSQFAAQIPAGGNYHLRLRTTIGPALPLRLRAGRSGNKTARVVTVDGTQCGTGTTTNPHAKVAIVDLNTIDKALQGYIADNKLGPSQFPFFMMYNSVMADGDTTGNHGVTGGYHAAADAQTYAIADFEGRNETVFKGGADVSGPSHEIAEWASDPTGNNPTPPWGGIGQVAGCTSVLENGDPLATTLMPGVTLGGFTYHLQEVAYFSWFYGGPSLAAHGKYSSNGTLAGPAKLCPPGGTN
jgi:hypothetical protein